MVKIKLSCKIKKIRIKAVPSSELIADFQAKSRWSRFDSEQLQQV
jgi:hypothetical protein